MTMSPTVEKIVQKRLGEAKKANNFKEMAMLNSGVAVLEEVIQEFLFKYALPANIYEARMSFDHILETYDTEANLDKQLKENENSLDLIRRQLDEIETRMENGEKAKRFKEDIRNYSWEKSEEYTRKIKSIEIGFTSMLDNFEQKLGSGEMRVDEAKTKIDWLKRDADLVMINVRKELERIIEKEVLTKINSFKDDYNKYVKGLIGEIGDVSPVMKELNKSVQLLLDPDAIIQEYKETRRERKWSEDTRWWNPFSWKRVTVEYDVVKMQDLYAPIAAELRASLSENKSLAEAETVEQIEACKNKFIKQMETIDTKIVDMMKEMRYKTASKEALDKSLKENRWKKEWLDGFQEELKSVLSI